MNGFPAYYTFTVPFHRSQYNGVCFTGDHKMSVPFIPADYHAQITCTENDGYILYRVCINHRPTIIAVIIVWLLAMFFSNFTVSQLLIFALVSSASIYFAIHRLTVRAVKTFLKSRSESSVHIQGKEQQWLNSSDRCPACGAQRESTSVFCPDCGLRLR